MRGIPVKQYIQSLQCELLIWIIPIPHAVNLYGSSSMAVSKTACAERFLGRLPFLR